MINLIIFHLNHKCVLLEFNLPYLRRSQKDVTIRFPGSLLSLKIRFTTDVRQQKHEHYENQSRTAS